MYRSVTFSCAVSICCGELFSPMIGQSRHSLTMSFMLRLVLRGVVASCSFHLHLAGVASDLLYCRRSMFFLTYCVLMSDHNECIHLLFARNNVVPDPQNGS